MEPTHTEQREFQGQVQKVETQVEVQKKDTNYVLPSAILIAAVLISGSILYTKGAEGSNSAVRSAKTVSAVSESLQNIREVSEVDHIKGRRDAEVIIVEFSDPECPYCKVFHQTMQGLMNEYGENGKLAWVYRHYPLDSLHRKARAEAEAMECAGFVGGNEAFWSFTDEVFSRTNSNDSLDSAELPKIASQIGLNLEAWNTCVSKRQTKEKIESDSDDAIAYSFPGPPRGFWQGRHRQWRARLFQKAL